METLQITKENALKAYNSGCPDVKKVLENLFDPKTFVQQKIADRVSGWNDIIVISKADPKDYTLRPGESDDELAYRQAKLIAFVYNEGSILDAGNTNQYKYYPWHKIEKDSSKPSGFGLSCGGCGLWDSGSRVGVRLCFKKESDAIDAGKKFIDIYERLKIR
jgi:hypothetical protein